MAHIKESHRKFFLARFKSKPRVLISCATVNKHFKNLKVHTQIKMFNIKNGQILILIVLKF